MKHTGQKLFPIIYHTIPDDIQTVIASFLPNKMRLVSKQWKSSIGNEIFTAHPLVKKYRPILDACLIKTTPCALRYFSLCGRRPDPYQQHEDLHYDILAEGLERNPVRGWYVDGGVCESFGCVRRVLRWSKRCVICARRQRQVCTINRRGARRCLNERIKNSVLSKVTFIYLGRKWVGGPTTRSMTKFRAQWLTRY